MKKRKSKPKQKWPENTLLFSVLGLLIILILFHLWPRKGPVAIGVEIPTSTTAVYYPTQYSDTHITANATVTDPRFKDVAMTSGNEFLANVSSSVTEPVQPGTGVENGTWLWTPTLDITPAYETQIISGAKANGIKNIYVSIDSYLDIFVMADSAQKVAEQKQFTNTLENFVADAHQNGMTVDAEAGWRNWAETGNTYKASAVVDYAMEFNQTEPEKLRGFQYDVEPYLLDNYDKNKAEDLGHFLTLVSQTTNMLKGSDLQFSVVVPEFYDGTNGATPSFAYDGKTDYTINHLLDILDKRPESKIIVMAYRNFSKGDNSSVAISQNEITDADTHTTKIVIAQETGDVQPSYVTFYDTNKKYYDSQVATIDAAFSKDKSFDGIATHYINAYLSLK